MSRHSLFVISLSCSFSPHVFLRPPFCDHCGRLIWRGGYKCSVCSFKAHKRCRDRVPCNCGIDEAKFMEQIKLLNVDPDRQDIDEISETLMKRVENLEAFVQILRSLREDREAKDSDDLESFKASLRRRITTNYMYSQEMDIKAGIYDYDLLAVIGEGACGKVFLSKHRTTSAVVAIKILSKDQILHEDSVENTINEKEVLKLGRPDNFILTLFASFQSSDKLFLVTEFLAGGDLLHHLQQAPFTARQTKFYAAEIFLALNFLHENNVVHRDVKPDNVLLDRHGHIKLIDYGLSKRGVHRRDLMKTLAGTPGYIAPEIIRQKRETCPEGYNLSVDWWCYGVLIYEVE